MNIIAAGMGTTGRRPCWARGVLVLAYVMLRGSKARLARMRAENLLSPQEQRNASRQADVVHDQLDHLMLQLEELARMTNAQIETRFAKLEILLADADKKIAQLEALIASAGSKPSGGQATGPVNGGPVKPEHRRVHELCGRRQDLGRDRPGSRQGRRRGRVDPGDPEEGITADARRRMPIREGLNVAGRCSIRRGTANERPVPRRCRIPKSSSTGNCQPPMLGAVPISMLLVDSDVRILWRNRFAREHLDATIENARDRRRAATYCTACTATTRPRAAGRGESCKDCVIPQRSQRSDGR